MAQTTLALTPPGTTGGSTDPFDDRRVIVVERKTEYPITELWADVFVVGPEAKQLYPMLARAQCRLAESIDKADIVFFSGSSSDVSPALYGEAPHSTVHWDSRVDVKNIEAFLTCVYAGIPMVGICGGAQFLHVANHGKLFQHIDNHNDGAHEIYLTEEKYYINEVSSCHHQACMANPENGMVVLAEVEDLSTTKWSKPNVCHTGLFGQEEMKDIEAFWYPDTVCFGVQGHPEYSGFDEYTAWFTKMIEQYIMHNPDIELVGEERQKIQRLKQEVLERRSYSVPKTFYDYLAKQTAETK